MDGRDLKRAEFKARAAARIFARRSQIAPVPASQSEADEPSVTTTRGVVTATYPDGWAFRYHEHAGERGAFRVVIVGRGD